jgi:hypothetical protein
MHLVQPQLLEISTVKTNQPVSSWYEHSSVCLSAFHPLAFKEEILTDHATSNILVDIVGPNTMGTHCLKIQFWL